MHEENSTTKLSAFKDGDVKGDSCKSKDQIDQPDRSSSGYNEQTNSNLIQKHPNASHLTS